jgi:hypothetical protein
MSFSYNTDGLSGTDTGLYLFDMTFEDVAKKALEEVRPDIEAETKSALRMSVQHPGESELVNSIKSYPPSMTRNGEGVCVKCLPTGRSKSGNRYNNHDRGRTVNKAVHNNDKAFWLEYGNAHQAAHPWRDRACNNTEERVLNKVEDAIAKELGAE